MLRTLTLIATLAPQAVLAELALVMVEQDGCLWCARWDAEVGPKYALTEEGEAAPLRRVDLNAPLPDDLDLESRPRLTPTFILTDDGTELSRLEGYPGEDFFWPLLAAMIERSRE